MGGTKEATIKLEGAEAVGVCDIYGGPLGLFRGMECVGTLELDQERAHTGSREGGAAINLNRSDSKK